MSILRDGAVSWPGRPHQPSLAARFAQRAYADVCIFTALALHLTLFLPARLLARAVGSVNRLARAPRG